MLISSSLLTSAAWQTAPIHSPTSTAQSVPSENGKASPAQPANVPAAPSVEHTASDTAQQKDATGAEASHPVARRGTIKTEDSQHTDSAAASGPAAPAPASDATAVAFQAVLNDVLPQVAEQTAQFTKQAANAKSEAALGQELADTAGTGKAVTQAIRAVAPDPSFQIARQTTAASAGDLNQKLAEGEVAFAARVAQRAGVQASVNLRDAQTVIAASRFDAPRTGANAGVNGDPQATLAVKKTDSAAPQQTKAPDEQTTQAAGSQLAGDGNANPDDDGQRDANVAEAEAGLRAASESQGDSSAMQLAQHTVTGMGAVMAPADGGVRSPGTARVPAEPGPPQIIEPQGETAARTGESVHEISLRLSNAEQGSVQVRLSERAGELQVTVRTPDTSLTRGLRDGLPDLIGRLQVNGYRAETWQPGGNSGNAGQDRGQDARGSSQQRQGGDNQQQSSQDQKQQDEQSPQWVHEMESSIQRSNSPWPASPAR